MPNKKAAIRRVRRVKNQTQTNRIRKSKYKNTLKQMESLIKAKNKEKAKKYFPKFQSILMQVAKTGIINKKTVSRWGIYKLNKKLNKTDYLIDGVVEKPSVKNAPSNNAVIGRYILPRTIFKKLKSLKPSKGNDIHITDAIQDLINDKEKFVAHNFEGKYLDCGTMKGYINSSKVIGKL